jgi:hypothetical protein
MTSPWGKLTAPVRHPTKKVNKAGELTYLYTNTEAPRIVVELTTLFTSRQGKLTDEERLSTVELLIKLAGYVSKLIMLAV